ELRCPGKASGYRNRRLRTRFIDRLCQAQVDDFRGHSAFVLEVHHDIARFDVPVNEALLVHCSQTGGDLRRNFQRQLYVNAARASDEVLERFPLHKLHRVEVVLAALLPKWKTEAAFGWRTLAAARASRKKRSRADSSPRCFSLMTFNVTGHRRSTSNAL